jgi:hypothetical protein
LITAIEVDRNGKKVRVYHRAGTIDDRRDERYSWTHPVGEACEACTNGTIPAAIRRER